jgi:malonyl-CoA/methylmalonyl-CoA synthetase
LLHGSSPPSLSPLLARLRAQGALAGQTDELAAALRDGRPSLEGAPVAFLMPAGKDFVDVLLAVLAAGGMAVPLSPLHTQPELAYIIANADPRLVVATPELAGVARAAAGGRRVVEAATLRSRGAPASFPATPPPAVAAAAPAILLYTSGTTGRPKGAVLSHAAVAATLASLAQAWRWHAGDRLLHVLPLHHTHGLIVALLGALWAGAAISFLPFDAARVWERLSDATVFMAVPTMYAKLIDAYRAAPADRRAAWAAGARGLRLFTSGSAALPAPLLHAFRDATGHTILERYGMTEIGMALSNRYDGPRVAGAVGVPLPGVEVDVVGDDEQPAADGQPGELRVRTPQLYSGYLGDDAATAAALDSAGRFRTGDTGTRDAADGVIRLMGRTSVDVLKSGGYKISALEIENALREHPDIADLAVVGVPDSTRTWGDLVTACVVPRAGAALTLDALKAFARDRLAVYKIPRALHLLDALPRNAMGKIQKKQLVDSLTAGKEPA